MSITDDELAAHIAAMEADKSHNYGEEYFAMCVELRDTRKLVTRIRECLAMVVDDLLPARTARELTAHLVLAAISDGRWTHVGVNGSRHAMEKA